MIAAIIVAVVAVVVAVVLAVALRRTRGVVEESGRQASTSLVALADARAELEALRQAAEVVPAPEPPAAEVAVAAVAVAVASEVAPSSDPVDDPGPTLAALWALTRIRQEWTSRQAAALNLDAEPLEGRWSSLTLADVLDDEVSKIREETGTPGSLRLSLPSEPPPSQSVLLMTSLQALLDALSRHCQGYDLYVHEWEGRLTAMVVCDAFDGPDRVASDTAAVLAALTPAGGDISLDRDSQGRLRARLSLAPTG